MTIKELCLLENEAIVSEYQRTGSTDCILILWERHQPLFDKYTRKYSRSNPELKQDLHQECYFALISAAKSFKVFHGSTFLSFLYRALQFRLYSYVNQTEPLVKLPQDRLSLIAKYAKLSIEHDDTEIQSLLGIDAKELQKIKMESSGAHIVSLDAPHGESEEGEPCTLGDLLEDRRSEDAFDEIVGEMERDRLTVFVAALPEPLRSIIAFRYMEDRPRPYKEIADILGLPIHTVRKSEHKAIKMIRTEVHKRETIERAAYATSKAGAYMRHGCRTSVVEECALG